MCASLLSDLKIARALKTKKICLCARSKKTKKSNFAKPLFLIFRACAYVRVGKNLKIFDTFQVSNSYAAQ